MTHENNSGAAPKDSATRSRIADPEPTAKRQASTVRQKRIAPDLWAKGFKPAPTPGVCCLCLKGIFTDSTIRRMPDGWDPNNKRRHAHRRCFLAWVADLEQATGQTIDLTVPADYDRSGPKGRYYPRKGRAK